LALRVRRVWRRAQTAAVSCRSRAGVGSDCGKGPLAAGQVCDGKTNGSEPLLTHRKPSRWHRNRGRSQAPGQRHAYAGAGSQGAACMLPWRCPVSRWREPVAGAGMEQENLSPRNRRPDRPGWPGGWAARGRTPSGGHREGQSTAGHRGGPARSSGEGPVMGLERRGRVTAATRYCPETATKLPAGGHENCPLAVMGSARHNVVCLAASRG